MIRILVVSLGLGLAVGALPGCKQGEGGVCQIDDDCESGLECNAGTMACQKPGSGGTPDAGPVDAGVLDAAVLDAAVLDAAVPDAMP